MKSNFRLCNMGSDPWRSKIFFTSTTWLSAPDTDFVNLRSSFECSRGILRNLDFPNPSQGLSPNFSTNFPNFPPQEVLECVRQQRLDSVQAVWARFWAGAAATGAGAEAQGQTDEELWVFSENFP